jgi:hypothetical protein
MKSPDVSRAASRQIHSDDIDLLDIETSINVGRSRKVNEGDKGQFLSIPDA